VARHEVGAGRRVVVTAGPGEEPLAAAVARGAGLGAAAVFGCGQDCLTLARAVAAAARVVCGDTGVAHLATALRRPSVLLFGPTSPDRWGPPPSRRHRHRVLWAGREGDPHGSTPAPGLLEIQPVDVTAALDEAAAGDATDARATSAAPVCAARTGG
jgi:ADP-heptose:LPS heptosyltransferase